MTTTKTDRELHTMTLDEVVDEYRHVSANAESYIDYRRSFPNMIEAIDGACKDVGYGCKHGRMTRFILLHALALAQNDPNVHRVRRMWSLASADSLMSGDDMKSAALRSLEPYSPQMVGGEGKLHAWDSTGKGNIKRLAEECGVRDFQFAQVYAIKSLLRSGVGLGESAVRFRSIVSDWERWLEQRAWHLYTIVVDRDTKNKLVNDFLLARPVKASSLREVVRPRKRRSSADTEWDFVAATTK